MTLITVLNTARVTLASDELVVPVEQVQSLHDAVQTAESLSALYEQEEARVRAAENAARERAQREGFAKGTARAAEQLADKLTVMQKRSEQERQALRSQATRTALEIVRRIAASLGEAETLAALARKAAQEFVPTAGVTVLVRPDVLEAVSSRLQGVTEPVLTVEPDDALEPGQCRLRGADGLAVLAGLETQLRNLERLSRRRITSEVAQA